MYFLIEDVAPGYGPRIFVLSYKTSPLPLESLRRDRLEEAHQYLKSLCCYGGSDKTWRTPKGEYDGYEFSRGRFSLAKETLAIFLGKPITEEQAFERVPKT